MISFNPRQTCLWIHRYTGLVMAAFLILAGLTGALLAFHDELDAIFNQRLAYVDNQTTPQLPIASLHDKVISAYPEYKFSSMPTTIEHGRSAIFTVDKERNKGKKSQSQSPSKAQPKPRFQEVYINPYTAEIIGTRDKDAWAWRNTMWKVFWLHRELLLGDIGKLILGIIALIWTLNCFIGFYLTFPRAVKHSNTNAKIPNKKRASLLKRWLPAWKIRTKTNTFKLNYDLHHAFGLWLWLMLFVIAWSSVGFNLQQVYQPVMQAVVGLEEKEGKENKADKSSEIVRSETGSANLVHKANSIEYLSKQATIAAQKNGLTVQQVLGIRWVAEDNQWQMRFKTNQDIGKKGGASSITVNAGDSSVEKVNFGYQNTSFGNKADQWLSTLHMGHISQGIGHLAYQIFLALIGLAVAILSGTGVYLWWKGRQQRLKSLQKLK